MMENWTNAKLCDVANLVLGAVLFFSPWMFAFEAGRASENAMIAGIVSRRLLSRRLRHSQFGRSG